MKSQRKTSQNTSFYEITEKILQKHFYEITERNLQKHIYENHREKSPRIHFFYEITERNLQKHFFYEITKRNLQEHTSSVKSQREISMNTYIYEITQRYLYNQLF
jgi:hypothetical protein